MPTQPVRRAFGFVGGFLALFFVLAFAMAFLRAGKGSTGLLPGESVVAVVPLEGEIERSDDFVETLAEIQDDQRYAAVVVGGTSLAGGEGKVFGTLIGALIIAVIQNGLNMAGVTPYERMIVFGGLILAAALLDQVKRRLWRGT